MAICEAANYASGTQRTVVNTPNGDDVTVLLARWRKGSAEAEAQLMERVQGELRRLAAGYLRRERGGQTLQPTAIVNEAYIRLLPQRGVSWENRAHFFGIAAKMMRRVLVDHARRRHAAKRDAGPADPVSISFRSWQPSRRRLATTSVNTWTVPGANVRRKPAPTG
jgi:RNA polymerase sigma factor (TIGR02999 family)